MVSTRDLAAPGSLSSPRPAAAPAGHALPGRVSDSGHHAVGSELENGIKPRRSTPTCGRTWVGATGDVSLQSLRSGCLSCQRWPHSTLCLLGYHSIPSQPICARLQACISSSQESSCCPSALLFLPSSWSMHNAQGIRVMRVKMMPSKPPNTCKVQNHTWRPSQMVVRRGEGLGLGAVAKVRRWGLSAGHPRLRWPFCLKDALLSNFLWNLTSAIPTLQEPAS